MRTRIFGRTTAVLAAVVATAMGWSMYAFALGDDEAGTPVRPSPSMVHGHNHSRHGGTAGGLPPSSEGVRLVGKMRVNQDGTSRVGDVGVLGNHAYLAAYSQRDCQKGGVYVFDVSNPATPKQVSFIRTANNSYVGEGIHPIHIDTPSFTGDLLAFNNEICGNPSTGAVGGMSLVDITDPKRSRTLVSGFGDLDPPSFTGQPIADMIHSVFVWDAGERAYAVTVDDEEDADVDIYDITNPRRPQLIAEHDLAAMFPEITQPRMPEVLHHDVVVKKVDGRDLMLVSYWDGGFVVLDVTDPLAPELVSDSQYAEDDVHLLEQTGAALPPEGNGHQAEFSRDDEYIVAGDEDFEPYSFLDFGTDVTTGQRFYAPVGSVDRVLSPGEIVEGTARYVGLACPGGDAVPPGDGRMDIAVVERGICFFNHKMESVVAAGGYRAIVIFNRSGGGGCNRTSIMAINGSVLGFGVIERDDVYSLFDETYDDAACESADPSVLAPMPLGGVEGHEIRFESTFDGWGYVHLFRNSGGTLEELDTYAIPEAFDPAHATGHGDLSVHEVAMSERADDLGYLAYYRAGLRVVRIVDDELVETGHYIDTRGNNFWGVQVWQRDGRELVLASDRDYGVYIFEYTGEGSPNP